MMDKNKYLIQQDLYATMFKKLDKDTSGYENKLVELTDKELEKMKRKCTDTGFIPEMYHQEEFGDGYRFVRDGEGLDDVKDFTYKQLKKFMNDSRKEVERKCRNEIINGNIDSIRSGIYPFNTGIRIYNILSKYAESNCTSIITFESIVYFVACVGNVYEATEILSMLESQKIYIHFIDCHICTANSEYEYWIEDYVDVLINEYVIDDILFKMNKEGQLSDEDFMKYNFTKIDYDESDYGCKEFDEIMNQYN